MVLMYIKWVAMATGDKNSNHGTQLLIHVVFITSFMLCKCYLHIADGSSRLSILARKVRLWLRKKSMNLGVGGEKYLII